MSNNSKRLNFFTLETDHEGVTLITLDRPPVNALSKEAYAELYDLAEIIEANDNTRCAVLAAPNHARAWCGGGDLKDFVGINYEMRLERFALITKAFERLFNLNRPIIAAINNHAIGAGFYICTLCDFRIASTEALFALPEIDRGIISGCGFFFRLRVPQGMLREMIFTGRRYTAEELRSTGIFNQIVAKDQVLSKALEVAHVIARKSLPALKANKTALNAGEMRTNWMETYLMTQKISAELTVGLDAKEGVQAFLERRKPTYLDK